MINSVFFFYGVIIKHIGILNVFFYKFILMIIL